MNNWILLMVFLLLMILVIAGFAIIMARKQRELLKKYPGYPAGYWQSRGMALGIAIGAGIGVALQNIAIGIGVGVALGAAFGVSNEKKHAKAIRPLTEEERQLKKLKILFASATFMVGLLIFVIAFLLNK